jgi:hypothetical protein
MVNKRKPRRGSSPRVSKGAKSHSALHQKGWAVITFGVVGTDLTYDDARRIAKQRTKEGPGATVVTNAAALRLIDYCRHGVGI